MCFRTTTEYYAEYTYIEVTSYLRCSSANLVCCSGYVYHPWSGQCVCKYINMMICKLCFFKYKAVYFIHHKLHNNNATFINYF